MKSKPASTLAILAAAAATLCGGALHSGELRIGGIIHADTAVSVTGAQSNLLATAIQAETDEIALAALSANRVTRWHDPADSNRWAEWEGMTNIVVYELAVSGTNYMVTLSADFEETINHTRPAWTNNVFPFTDGGWVGEKQSEDMYTMAYHGGSIWGGYVSVNYPINMVPSVNAQGTATVSRVYTYTTNETHRYHLPTNAVPAELTNLDLLQAWMNDRYATTNYVGEQIAGYQSAAYWPPNATASSWFTFTTNSGAITITGYNNDGGTDVVIPDYINGWPVTEIGANAFEESGVTSIGGAGNVVTVGDSAFYGCPSLTSVSLPQAQTVEDLAFRSCGVLTFVLLPHAQTIGVGAIYDCGVLTSVSLPHAQTIDDSMFGYCDMLTSIYFDNDAPTIGVGVFAGITPNQVTIYVTNPQATGWGDTLGDMPVVRLPLHADAIYQAGELVATTQHVAQAIAAIPEPDMSDRPTFSQIAASNALPYTAWTGTITPANGTATVAIAHGNMPVLVTDAPCVLTLDPTGYGTAGVSRVSLSYYPGTNSFTFATNIIKYAETPTVDTNGWNSLLLRRISNGTWKGVGL